MICSKNGCIKPDYVGFVTCALCCTNELFVS